MEIVIGIMIVVGLWLLLTGKNRRARKLKDEIYAMVRSGRENAILDDVYFEAALKFALESGAELERGEKAYDATSIMFPMNIDGTNYFIYFAKQGNGSTFIGVTDADESSRQYKARINQTGNNEFHEKIDENYSEKNDDGEENDGDDDEFKEKHSKFVEHIEKKGPAYRDIISPANKGNANLQFLLGMMFYSGEEYEGVEFKQSYKRAFWWIAKAAKNGEKLAQENISLVDADLVKSEEDKYASIDIKTLISRSQKGNAACKYYLGKKYLIGNGVEKSIDKAITMIREAARQGYDEAQYDLATMYFEGNIIDKDIERAFVWYNKAAEQGYPSALEKLFEVQCDGNPPIFRSTYK